MSDWIDALALATVVGSGVVAGVWFAFSGFVMRGLARLTPSQGAVAMQSINVTAVRPPLMLAMFGVALACLVLGGWALLSLSDARAGWLLAGSALYLAGTVLVTMVGNVPLNDALASVDPDSPEGQREWASYLSAWTHWNSVRAAATIAATALLGVGMLQGG